MSAPHVAGLVALLISAQPSLAGQTDLLQSLIEQSAVPKTSTQDCGGVDSDLIPNNVYGWGRINAYAALNSIPPTFTIEKTASTTLAVPDQPLTYTLTITYHHPINPASSIVLTDVVPLNTSFLDATPAYTLQNGVVRWNFPSMSNGQSQVARLTVQVQPAAVDTITNQSYGVKSSNVAAILGIPLPISFARYLAILPMVFKQFP